MSNYSGFRNVIENDFDKNELTLKRKRFYSYKAAEDFRIKIKTDLPIETKYNSNFQVIHCVDYKLFN